jgi:hypothetical protein
MLQRSDLGAQRRAVTDIAADIVQLSFPLKVASLVRRNWLPADLNLTT